MAARDDGAARHLEERERERDDEHRDLGHLTRARHC
jgi:predicted Rdx family selenoprotein